MDPVRLPNGNLLVPKRMDTSETPTIAADGMVEVEPGTPDYERWLPWAREPD